MKTQKAIDQFSKEYVGYLNEIAQKHGTSIVQAQKDYAEFIRMNYIFTGKGGIWKTFKRLPKPYEFYLQTKLKEVDILSSLEIVSFVDNVPFLDMMNEIDSGIAEAYQQNKDNEIWQMFDKQPTVQELGAVLINLIKNVHNDNQRV